MNEPTRFETVTIDLTEIKGQKDKEQKLKEKLSFCREYKTLPFIPKISKSERRHAN